jgi:hypothetical protein
LTGTKDFSDFVKPRVAVGPKGNHNPEMLDMPTSIGQTNRNSFDAYFMNASYKTSVSTENAIDRSAYKPDFAKLVKIAANQTVEVEIPVEQALNFGLTFMAASDVSATLFDDKGTVVGKNLTKTPEANALFRSIFVDKNVTRGTWKLKLENTSERELEAILATWKDAAK